MKGDYLQADGNRSHNNVYLFRFAIDGGKIQRVGEYANPVTFAKLADLPIGGVRPPPPTLVRKTPCSPAGVSRAAPDAIRANASWCVQLSGADTLARSDRNTIICRCEGFALRGWRRGDLAA
jgi:hypothetical protein